MLTMSSRSDGLITAARSVVDPLVARLASKPEVVGVALLSSIARTGERVTFDEQSDVDLAVWIDVPMRSDEWRPNPRDTRRLVADRVPPWAGNFSFHLPVLWGAVELNVHQRIYAYDADPRTTWDDSLREAVSYTREIVYDRGGRLSRLIVNKAGFAEGECQERIITLTNRLLWDLHRIPKRMVYRGDTTAGHLMVSFALDEVIELLYLLAGRFPPHRKWRFDGLTRFGLASADELELIRRALLVTALTEDDCLRRIGLVEQLWSGVKVRLPSDVPDDPYRFYSAHISANRQLRSSTVADVAQSRHGETLGPDVYDLVNALVVDRLEDLAELDDETIASLPDRWRPLARQLARLVQAELLESS
jgi:hypothetical protein